MFIISVSHTYIMAGVVLCANTPTHAIELEKLQQKSVRRRTSAVGRNSYCQTNLNKVHMGFSRELVLAL